MNEELVKVYEQGINKNKNQQFRRNSNKTKQEAVAVFKTEM